MREPHLLLKPNSHWYEFREEALFIDRLDKMSDLAKKDSKMRELMEACQSYYTLKVGDEQT